MGKKNLFQAMRGTIKEQEKDLGEKELEERGQQVLDNMPHATVSDLSAERQPVQKKTNPPKKRERLCMTVSGEVRDKLEALAMIDDISLSGVIEKLVLDAADRKADKIKAVLELREKLKG